MIKIEVKNIDVYGGNLLIPITDTVDLSEIEKAMKEDKYIRVEITVPRAKRSLSANAYCWSLCQQIAEELSKGDRIVRKEDVYRKSIQELFEPVVTEISNEDVDEMKAAWKSRGIGWICEDLGESSLYGRTRLGFYVGSSTFDTKQMARLIDGLIQDADALGISTLSPKDRDLLVSQWEKDRRKSE